MGGESDTNKEVGGEAWRQRKNNCRKGNFS